MIFEKTVLTIADNSGAIAAECIRVLKKALPATIGDLVVVAVKKAYFEKKVRTHDVRKALVVRTRKGIYRPKEGIHVSFGDNSVVFVDSKNNPIANRIKGPVTRELRGKKFMKIVAIAPSII